MMQAPSIGVVGLLGIVFVTLKLCHVIAWSWWWVTLPFWAGFALVTVYLIFGIASVLLGSSVHDRRRR